MLYIERQTSQRAQTLAHFFPVLVLTGARQTGKTTLLRATFPHHHYVSLDLPSEAEAAQFDPDGYLRRHPLPLLVDEVHYAPELFRHIKAVVDASPERNGQVILTGSQKFALMRGVVESLAGRAAILDLENLSASEIRGADPANAILADTAMAIHRGFFPVLWRQPEMPSAEFYASYVATYLERDLRQALDVSNLNSFERFMRLCAARTGQLLNKSDLARDAGISGKTADAWLSALEACNQITLVQPWFTNIGKRLVKAPKLYFNDCGLAAFLMGLDAGAVRASAWSGPLWETAVCAELRKQLGLRPTGARLHFYRDADGLEVDFLVGSGVAVDLIECKWTELPTGKDAVSLNKLARQLSSIGCPVRRRYVACRTRAPFPIGDTINGNHAQDRCVAVNGLELEGIGVQDSPAALSLP